MLSHRKPFHLKPKSTLSQQIANGYKELLITIITLNIVLAILLLYVGNIGTSQGYILKKLQLENDTLYNESKLLDRQVTNVKALKSIRQNDSTKPMTPVDKFTFIKGDSIMVKHPINSYPPKQF